MKTVNRGLLMADRKDKKSPPLKNGGFLLIKS